MDDPVRHHVAADPVDTREQATTRYDTPKEIIRRHAPLPRHYFKDHTIWGKEDGRRIGTRLHFGQTGK